MDKLIEKTATLIKTELLTLRPNVVYINEAVCYEDDGNGDGETTGFDVENYIKYIDQ